MKSQQNSQIYGIIVTALLILSAGLGWFFWQKSKNIFAEKERSEKERLTLETQKSAITHSLDSLAVAYSSLRTENENLQGKITSTASLVEQKDRSIQELKSQSAKNVQELRDQVALLEKVKTEYETILSVVRDENTQLKEENQRLSGENRQLRGETQQLTGKLAELGQRLEEQVRKTQSAGFKATSFRVEVERRNDKLTTRARRAREVVVTFDVADVPQPFQGPQKLYMVILDDKGSPIPSVNPIQATVYAPTGPLSILAQQVKAVALETTQRLAFNYKIDERLKAGVYVVAIYCDKGLLGAHSFRLV